MKRGFVKKMLMAVLAFALVLSTAFAFTDEAKAASTLSSITVKGSVKDKVSLHVNGTKTLVILNADTDAKLANSGFTFKSSNSKVVSVNAKGVITAKKTGKATITITNKKNTKVKYTLTVVVPTKAQYVKSVKLNQTKVTLNADKTKVTLKATVNPSKAMTKLVSWSSSNTKVAKVNANGVVTAVGPGTAKITVKTLDGAKTATCTVTVTKATALKLSATSATLNVKGTKQIKATLTPANAYDKLTYTSSNKSVATVSSTGKVTAVAPGKATITVKTQSGKIAKYTVTVKQPAKSVKVKADKTTINANETVQLTTTLTPANSTDTVKYTVSDSKVASVSSKGVLKVKTNVATTKTVKVTATATSGVKSTVSITIVGTENAVSNANDGYTISLDKSAESFKVDDSAKSTSYVVTPAQVAADEAVAEEQLKTTVSATAPAKAIYEAITEKNITAYTILSSNASIAFAESGSTKTVTVTPTGAKAHTVEVTLVSDTELKVVFDGKTATISNLAATITSDKYTYTAYVKTEKNDLNVKVAIDADAGKVIVTDTDADARLASFNDAAKQYDIILKSVYYNKFIEAYGTTDKLAGEVTVTNDYNAVAK